ncbi:MAG: sigma-70 family RNA polymerase sigma factor [Opitutales bacterium]|nr:sigma-70 family RNA polymerase sigma factor [Opitutales bacterium]
MTLTINTPEEKKHNRFLGLFTAHESSIHAYVRKLVYRREDASDVMQKTVIVLWKKFDQLQSDDDFRKWSFGVARYEVLSWRRDLARERERLVLSTDIIELMAEELEQQSEQLDLEKEAILQHCLGKLKKEQRLALQSMYENEENTPDLAKKFGKSVTGFYQWIYRIRQTLSECARKFADAT